MLSVRWTKFSKWWCKWKLRLGAITWWIHILHWNHNGLVISFKTMKAYFFIFLFSNFFDLKRKLSSSVLRHSQKLCCAPTKHIVVLCWKKSINSRLILREVLIFCVCYKTAHFFFLGKKNFVCLFALFFDSLQFGANWWSKTWSKLLLRKFFFTSH